MPPPDRQAIILFAHGSRDPDWARPFRKIQRAIRARQPGVTVRLAFLEIMEPTLDKAVAELVGAGRNRITIAPLFMAQGAHLKNDLSRITDALRAEHRGAKIMLLPAIGEARPIVSAICNWLSAAMTR